jgi:TorA maturation chaperone TorD
LVATNTAMTAADSSSDGLARTAIEVSNLYGFLAAVFREEVSEHLLAQLRSPNLRDTLTDAGITLDDRLLRGPDQEVLRDLAVEFAALFLGPGEHISPHESVHLPQGGNLWGAETVAVRNFVNALGFDYDDGFSGMPDHISVELELMAELTRRESVAWGQGDTDGAGNSLAYQCQFMAEHLAKWVPTFCSEVVKNAGMSFYRDMARLTAEFLKSEQTDIERRLDIAKDG